MSGRPGRHWYFERRGFAVFRRVKPKTCSLCGKRLMKTARGARCINLDCEDGRA